MVYVSYDLPTCTSLAAHPILLINGLKVTTHFSTAK